MTVPRQIAIGGEKGSPFFAQSQPSVQVWHPSVG